MASSPQPTTTESVLLKKPCCFLRPSKLEIWDQKNSPGSTASGGRCYCPQFMGGMWVTNLSNSLWHFVGVRTRVVGSGRRKWACFSLEPKTELLGFFFNLLFLLFENEKTAGLSWRRGILESCSRVWGERSSGSVQQLLSCGRCIDLS